MVVVVDGSADVRDAVRDFLRALRCDVVAAATGETAVELCRQRAAEVELLITDIHLPGMTGHEVIAHYRRACPGLPVVVLSSCAPSARRYRGGTAAAVAWLPKPFALRELEARVVEALAGGRASIGDRDA